jgi:hypothetical protein
MNPTTAVISVRPLRARPWYAHIRAAEDLFVATTGAVRHDIEGPSGWVSDARWARRALRTAKRWPSALTPAPTTKADVAVMWTSDLGDVGELLDVADGWVDVAATKVLVVSECWPDDLELHGPKVRSVIEMFDAVFVCMENDCLAPVAGPSRSVHHLAHGAVTDAYRPNLSGTRSMGVLNYGRRDPDQHDALVAWSDSTGGWYHWDASKLGATPDPREHQRVLGRMMSEASGSVCNLGRFDEQHRTGGAEELGARFYESLAAGCVLLGEFPSTPTYDAHFADAPGMIPFPLGASSLPDAFLRLLDDHEAAGRIQREHRARALAEHDIAHRIAEMMDTTGFEVPEALALRQAALRHEAEELRSS